MLEIEAGPGFIINGSILGPLKIFDTQVSRLRNVMYDYGTYYEKAWIYNKPYAVVRGLGAVALLEFNGGLTFYAARSDVDEATLPSQRTSKSTGLEASVCPMTDAVSSWYRRKTSFNAFNAKPGQENSPRQRASRSARPPSL
uniref:hypothetical protein n=1 Tax=Bradyrhizobium barranii TaxID=2992140 RepID=UPI00140941D8|nr:hypothetical protein [Bradyrhizobium barranii]